MTEKAACRRCLADPQPAHFASPRNCAFDSDGRFVKDNCEDDCPHCRAVRVAPHAALLTEIDATLAMVNEDGRGHCQLCEHPPVAGEVAENQHYNDCLFFTLRRCKAAILGGQG